MLHAGHGQVTVERYLYGVLLTLLAVAFVAVLARWCLRAVGRIDGTSVAGQDAGDGDR